MRFAVLLLGYLSAAGAENARYELRGHFVPPAAASVWLHGATAPFEDSTLSGEDGRFRFRDLLPGTYTLGAFFPGRGELRRTIEVGPSQADAKNRVDLTLKFQDSDLESQDSLRRGHVVSAQDLAIPDRARRQYEEALKKLSRHDTPAAVARLEEAVKLAPGYAVAWNNLGTIAYQTREYARAESCFRKALAADPAFFQPLVNLGGVLINLSHFDEALAYNLHATLTRPNDALANSQLGMTYFYQGKLDLARKYLEAARRLDPAHFSHPQLLLAEIALCRQDRAAASAALEEFVQYHPDSPEVPRIKDHLAQLRSAAGPPEAFAATGMARSFSESFELPSSDAPELRNKKVDAAIGSGRHLRILLSRDPAGGWSTLPLAWLSENGGGKYIPEPGFGFTSACLSCHASGTGDHAAAHPAAHPAGMTCESCHGSAASGAPAQAVCLRCHVDTAGPNSAHRAAASGEDRFELNSAAYRLVQSRCYQAAAAKLACGTCHPAHTFQRTAAEYRQVCRGCHPSTHSGAALECTRCHMPKRPAQDMPLIQVTDHRIQRPL